MGIIEAIILGIIQGLTEFLPVSSSGHLELASHLFGIDEPNNLGFEMALHGGTVLSTIVVFWSEITKLGKGVFRFEMNAETKFVINILISLIPIGVVGLLFKGQIETLFTGNLILVGSMLLVTAALLTFTHYKKPGYKEVTPLRAFVIGLAQAVAVVPGLSRSGSTISTGLIMGVKREEMSKFSFLMVLIPIIGMNLLQLIKGSSSEISVGGVPLAAGFITAFVVGTVACKWMISIVNRGKLVWFAGYCLIVGAAAIIGGMLNY